MPVVEKYMQMAQIIDLRMRIAKEEETEGYLRPKNHWHWKLYSEGVAGRVGVGRAMRQEKNARMVRSGKRHGYTDIDC